MQLNFVSSARVIPAAARAFSKFKTVQLPLFNTTRNKFQYNFQHQPSLVVMPRYAVIDVSGSTCQVVLLAFAVGHTPGCVV